jgi:hypothetical protein
MKFLQIAYIFNSVFLPSFGADEQNNQDQQVLSQ